MSNLVTQITEKIPMEAHTQNAERDRIHQKQLDALGARVEGYAIDQQRKIIILERKYAGLTPLKPEDLNLQIHEWQTQTSLAIQAAVELKHQERSQGAAKRSLDAESTSGSSAQVSPPIVPTGESGAAAIARSQAETSHAHRQANRAKEAAFMDGQRLELEQLLQEQSAHQEKQETENQLDLLTAEEEAAKLTDPVKQMEIRRNAQERVDFSRRTIGEAMASDRATFEQEQETSLAIFRAKLLEEEVAPVVKASPIVAEAAQSLLTHQTEAREALSASVGAAQLNAAGMQHEMI